MLKRLALAALLASLPTRAVAQSAAPSAAICDGAEMHRAERVRDIGGVLLVGTAAADLAAMLTVPRNPGGVETARNHFRFVAATAPVALAGFLMARNAYPRQKFWERAIARMKVGETKAADVRLCLHRPTVVTSNGSVERWTYIVTRPGRLDDTFRTVRLTFRDSVLTNVDRTEVNRYASATTRHDWPIDEQRPRRRGFCTPPIPVIADPFPTTTDTTAAGAAMARARADADAAAKNAANAAAYASCMASDSAF